MSVQAAAALLLSGPPRRAKRRHLAGFDALNALAFAVGFSRMKSKNKMFSRPPITGQRRFAATDFYQPVAGIIVQQRPPPVNAFFVVEHQKGLSGCFSPGA